MKSKLIFSIFGFIILFGCVQYIHFKVSSLNHQRIAENFEKDVQSISNQMIIVIEHDVEKAKLFATMMMNLPKFCDNQCLKEYSDRFLEDFEYVEMKEINTAKASSTTNDKSIRLPHLAGPLNLDENDIHTQFLNFEGDSKFVTFIRIKDRVFAFVLNLNSYIERTELTWRGDLKIVTTDNQLVYSSPNYLNAAAFEVKQINSIFDSDFVVSIRPTITYLNDQNSTFSLIIQIGGFFLSLVFGTLIYLYIKNKETVATLKLAQIGIIENSKFAAIGQLAGGIAHEFNTPLAVIKAKSSLLKKRALESDSVASSIVIEHAEKVILSIDRITKITKGLLSFAQESTGNEKAITNLADIYDSVLSMISEKMKSHGIKVSIDTSLDPKTVFINCDRIQIQQVLINLINNSYQAIHNFEPNKRWIRIRQSLTPDNSLKIYVADSGNGIPGEIASKMMQPFFTTKEVGQGTGLGLSISKGICNDHGGDLKFLTNSVNTEFEISLPKASVSRLQSAA